MPGSGIAVNYLDAKRNLEDVQRMSGEVTEGALTEISAHINTQGDSVPVVIFNPLSWPRTDVVEVEAQLPALSPRFDVIDASGKPALSQLLSMDSDTHRARLLVLASLPSLGYKTYIVRAASETSADGVSQLKASADTLENEFTRVTVDPFTGCMTSLFGQAKQHRCACPYCARQSRLTRMLTKVSTNLLTPSMRTGAPGNKLEPSSRDTN